MTSIVPKRLRQFVHGRKRYRKPWMRLGKGNVLLWFAKEPKRGKKQ